jgi:DNA-binding NtrC family response regulator
MQFNSTEKLRHNVSHEIKKILIADYEELIIASLYNALQKKRVEVKTCNEFEQVVDAIITTRYDLFITDICMLGIRVFKGLELLGFIKRHFCSEVIVMSGYSWRESETELCRLNGLNYINKPLNIKEVMTICERINIPIKEYLLW